MKRLISKILLFKQWILFVCIFLVAFIPSTIKYYITVHGEKYYKCQTKYETDTIESPDATIMIVKKQIILYNHFGCDGLK
jgi:hypothetical protein